MRMPLIHLLNSQFLVNCFKSFFLFDVTVYRIGTGIFFSKYQFLPNIVFFLFSTVIREAVEEENFYLIIIAFFLKVFESICYI
jgi:hypothetical protein